MGSINRDRSKFLSGRVRKLKAEVKGHEADAVILVDVDEHTFEEENVLRYYVGASRARVRLDMITMMDNEECIRVLTNRFKYSKKIKKPMRELAYALNALPAIENDE